MNRLNWKSKRDSVLKTTEYTKVTDLAEWRIVRSYGKRTWCLVKHELNEEMTELFGEPEYAIKGEIVDSGWTTAKDAKIDADRFYI